MILDLVPNTSTHHHTETYLTKILSDRKNVQKLSTNYEYIKINEMFDIW